MPQMLMRQPQDTISKFVGACAAQVAAGPGTKVLDIPCGYGRHARFFASRGCSVVAVDIDEERIFEAKKISSMKPIYWCTADIEAPLPFADNYFDLVLVVHYVSNRIVEIARNALKPGGHLIFETFDARGQNWRALPARGSMERALENKFDVISINERLVGPKLTHAVVRTFARHR